MPRHLAVFDIDGTLIQFQPAGNDKCYLRAVEEEWGVTGVRDDVASWGGFKHATDSGVTHELFHRRHHREPLPEEVEKLKARLMALFDREFTIGGKRFDPIAGAVGIFDAVRAAGPWDVAIATGNWADSARFKLTSAGVWQDDVPLGSADDAMDRADIITAAVEKARAASGTDRYRRVVYIGDAPWDVDAASRLEIGFLGVAHGPRVIELMDAGAMTIFRDFADREVFLESLREFER